MTTPDKPKKRRMSVNVAVKYHRKLEGQMTELARKCLREQRSFDWMLKAYTEVCSGPDWERAPQWVHSRAQAWMTCFLQFVVPDMMTEWHVWEKGRGHVNKRSEPKVDYSKVDADKGARLWKGSSKVWHGYDPTGEASKLPTDEEMALFGLTFGPVHLFKKVDK